MLPGTSAVRMALATLAIVLAIASAGSIESGAQTKTPSTPSTTPSVVLPYGDRQFTPMDPANPNGTHISVLRGHVGRPA